MKRLGMPVSDDTILRHLKRQVARLCAKTTVRVAGIDDWSWRKGCTTGALSLTWSGARLSMCCRIAQPPEQPNGLASILRSKSSAAIAAVCMRRARERARLRRGRSRTASISCRTCARRSSPS
jgi:hypothetical protein